MFSPERRNCLSSGEKNTLLGGRQSFKHSHVEFLSRKRSKDRFLLASIYMAELVPHAYRRDWTHLPGTLVCWLLFSSYFFKKENGSTIREVGVKAKFVACSPAT